MNSLHLGDYSIIGLTALEKIAVFIVCTLVRNYADKIELPQAFSWLLRFDWDRLTSLRWFMLYSAFTDVLLAPVAATHDRQTFWILNTYIEISKTIWLCWLAGATWNWNGHRDTKYYGRLPFIVACSLSPLVLNAYTVTAEGLAYYHWILQCFAFVMLVVGIVSVVSARYLKVAAGLALATMLAALANLCRMYLGYFPKLWEIGSLIGTSAILFAVSVFHWWNGNRRPAAASQ